MINIFFPTYFVFSLFPYARKISFIYFLFIGFFLDRIVYYLPFIHTIFFFIVYCFHFALKPPLKRRNVNIRMFVTLTVYFFLISLYSLNFYFWYYIFELIWNVIIVNLIYEKDRIYINKKNIRYLIIF